MDFTYIKIGPLLLLNLILILSLKISKFRRKMQELFLFLDCLYKIIEKFKFGIENIF